MTLSLADEAGICQPGDSIALLGIGSGINCMMMGLQW
jgi:3-oxoacyl-[acyl-carrier-protein] synthase III